MAYTLDRYFKEAKLKNTIPFAPFINMVLPEDGAPRQHQIKNLNKLLTNDHWGLYDDPGTGKTLTAHAFFLYWVSEGQRTVAVMPPNLTYQFQEELYSIYQGSEKYVTSHVLDQGPEKRRNLYAEWKKFNTWPQMLIMSYQMFYRECATIEKHYSVGIFDEVQELKNSKSAIFNLVTKWQHKKGGTSAVFMTGTPIHNELIDLYAQIELTTPGSYSSLESFERQHCTYTTVKLKTPRRTKNGRWQRGFKQRTGYKNVTALNKLLYKHASRILKKDVQEITAPTIIEVAVKLEHGHLKLYKKLVKERLLDLRDKLIIADNAQSLRQQCLQIVTCPELFTDNMNFNNNVVSACKDLINTVDIKNTKVLMFANYQNSVKNLAQYFEEYNPALMYGPANSEAARKKFLKDDTCRLMIAHPKSAGVGLNLQGVCHTIIFSEPTGVPGDFKQCMSRVDRSGQKNLVNVYVIKALDTISPKATREMLRKETEAQEVYHDSATFLSDFKVAA